MSAGGEQRAREASEIVGRREQARMSRDPAERPGVAIVHLAPDEAGGQALVAVELGRCDQSPRVRGREIARVLHSERLRHGLLEEALERHAGARFERPAEQHVVEVAVADRTRRDSLGSGLGDDGAPDSGDAAGSPVELPMRDQARTCG